MVIDLYPKLNIRFNFKLGSEPVFEKQKRMYHSQVFTLMDPFL